MKRARASARLTAETIGPQLSGFQRVGPKSAGNGKLPSYGGQFGTGSRGST
jgi:hypothetical protein